MNNEKECLTKKAPKFVKVINTTAPPSSCCRVAVLEMLLVFTRLLLRFKCYMR